MNPSPCQEALALSEDLDLERLHISIDCLRDVREIEAPKNLGGHCMVFLRSKNKEIYLGLVFLVMNNANVIRSLID